MAVVDSVHASLCEVVAEMMSATCGRPFPRAHLSFLALGGTEGQAVELTQMINALFGLDLPADTVMRSPTPDALARTIESSWPGSRRDLVELIDAIADAA
jgi:Phosphopantetheine attachment site